MEADDDKSDSDLTNIVDEMVGVAEGAERGRMGGCILYPKP